MRDSTDRNAAQLGAVIPLRMSRMSSRLGTAKVDRPRPVIKPYYWLLLHWSLWKRNAHKTGTKNIKHAVHWFIVFGPYSSTITYHSRKATERTRDCEIIPLLHFFFNLPCTQELRLNLARSCQRPQPDTHVNVSFQRPSTPSRCLLKQALWPPNTPGRVRHTLSRAHGRTWVCKVLPTPTPSQSARSNRGAIQTAGLPGNRCTKKQV